MVYIMKLSLACNFSLSFVREISRFQSLDIIVNSVFPIGDIVAVSLWLLILVVECSFFWALGEEPISWFIASHCNIIRALLWLHNFRSFIDFKATFIIIHVALWVVLNFTIFVENEKSSLSGSVPIHFLQISFKNNILVGILVRIFSSYWLWFLWDYWFWFFWSNWLRFLWSNWLFWSHWFRFFRLFIKFFPLFFKLWPLIFVSWIKCLLLNSKIPSLSMELPLFTQWSFQIRMIEEFIRCDSIFWVILEDLTHELQFF